MITLKVMLHGTTCNNDFSRNTASTFRDMLNESPFCATSHKMNLATYMLHETIFNATLTRNISRARPGHVEQNSGKVLREKATATLLHESLLNIRHLALRVFDFGSKTRNVLLPSQKLREKSSLVPCYTVNYFSRNNEKSLLQVVPCNTTSDKLVDTDIRVDSLNKD